ncbi:MAG: hypothetical protein HY930_02695 [Euryarchaeota archaeon]|nr:hypothetical protein [Euryarchaeota archaeon]
MRRHNKNKNLTENMKKKSESKLYKRIEEYIKKKFDCKDVFINRGTIYGRVDVIGWRYQKEEMVGEDPDKNPRIAFGQAFGMARRLQVGLSHEYKHDLLDSLGVDDCFCLCKKCIESLKI